MIRERYIISNGPAGVIPRSPSPTAPLSSPGPGLAPGEIARTCLVCSTKLKVPEDIQLFRCSTCSTVSDLNVAKSWGTPLVLGEIWAWEAGIRHHRHWPYVDDTLAFRVHEVFASFHSLERSFTRHGTPEEVIDIDIVIRYYTRLVKERQASRALLAELASLLVRPSVYAEGMLEEALPWRWAIILCLCPLLLSKSSHIATADREELLARVCGVIANLPSPQQHRICRLWSRNVLICLPPLVNALNSIVARRLARCRTTMEKAYMQDWRLIAAVKILSICFVANRRAHERGRDALSPEVFWTVAVDALAANTIIKDFELFKKLHKITADGTPAPFLFCSYPHTLSIGSKMAILSYESKKHQTACARSAMRATRAGLVESPFLTLQVRRSHVVQDSLQQLFANRYSLRKALRISFTGEEGIDAGGLLKEWLLLLSGELFSSKFGMFTTPDEDSNLCWFNELSPTSETEAEFYLVGAVVGLAVYSSSPIEIPLPLAAYKKLIKATPTFQDLKVLHPALARGLEQLLTFEGDVENTFCRTFVAEREVFGEVQEFELKPNGRNIAVTSANRQEFVDLVTQYTFGAADLQFKAFAKGFNQICGGNALSLFSAQELELLVRGQEPSALDVDTLQACAYTDGWTGKDDPTPKLFWQYLRDLNVRGQRKLLAFICGSGRLPATGALKLRISCGGKDLKRLPTSHTCFNQLVLPRFTNMPDLAKALKTAVDGSTGFGLK